MGGLERVNRQDAKVAKDFKVVEPSAELDDLAHRVFSSRQPRRPAQDSGEHRTHPLGAGPLLVKSHSTSSGTTHQLQRRRASARHQRRPPNPTLPAPLPLLPSPPPPPPPS